MTESEFYQLLQRYLTGQCTPEEGALVERIYKSLGQLEEHVVSQPEQAQRLAALWQRLAARTQTPAPPRRQLPAALWQLPARRWAAAAGLALLVGAGGVGLLLSPPAPRATVVQAPRAPTGSSWTRRTNATGRAQAIALPDGSLVTLQPGGSLRYATDFAGSRREVYFSGDAFFEVHKDAGRPFLVLTKQVVTTVLGTSFRVLAPADNPNATVTVREGRVSVQARAGAHLEATPNRPAAAGVLLLPNQQAAYSGAANRLRKELATAPAVLVPQSFVFDARPVAEVLAALQKAYGVAILFDRGAVANCTVTLNLDDKTLDGKLAVLCEALSASYEKAGTQILFHSQGCQSK